jgi:hypothetical protein
MAQDPSSAIGKFKACTFANVRLSSVALFGPVAAV